MHYCRVSTNLVIVVRKGSEKDVSKWNGATNRVQDCSPINAAVDQIGISNEWVPTNPRKRLDGRVVLEGGAL